jgi:hypothetical protein
MTASWCIGSCVAVSFPSQIGPSLAESFAFLAIIVSILVCGWIFAPNTLRIGSRRSALDRRSDLITDVRFPPLRSHSPTLCPLVILRLSTPLSPASPFLASLHANVHEPCRRPFGHWHPAVAPTEQDHATRRLFKLLQA